MNEEKKSRVPPIDVVFPDAGLRRAAAFAEAGDVAQLRLMAGVDLDAEMPAGVNLLMYEIAAQNEVAVRALLEAGANPNALTSGCASPMLIAGASEEKRFLALLLDNGGDPNLRDQKEEPLLTRLVFHERFDNVLLLLDRGAKIDATGPAGRTATFLYGTLHQFDRVHALLERGADPSIQDQNGLSLKDFVLQRVVPESPQVEWQKRVAEKIGL